tara:strand:- start:9332 stop:10150 length:819 start_codon:yes stop_codon:yes gene_type:complete
MIEELGTKLRQALLDEIEFARYYPGEHKVAVLLSGGVDSNSVLFAAMELGLNPVGYSFTIKGHESTDFKLAKATCEEFGIPFTPVYLPTSVSKLKKYLKYAVSVGAKSKTDFECFWPMREAFLAVKEPCILSATSADSHFGLSKKAMIHFRDSIPEYQINVFRKPNTGQRILLRAEAVRLGKHYLSPYDTTRVLSLLHGYTWEELNKPQKRPIRDAFPEYFSRIKLKPHTNLQLGDSGIAKHFEKLLDDRRWNRFGYKSVKGIYNKLVSGEI